MDLFQSGTFKLAAGSISDFKIECDALSDAEVEALAGQLVARLPPFRWNVYGIPRGGLRIARAMEKYAQGEGGRLIVDDVYTTGRSFREFMNGLDMNEAPEGWLFGVFFARTQPPDFITALFQMS